jgi:cytoskeletal protein CcmA (bactofilin family)
MKHGFRVRVLALSTVAAATFSLCLGTASSAAAAETGDISKVNESVHVDGGEHAGDVSTVNGSIHIGESAVVKHVHAVNGTITVDSRVTADKVDTVNGSIRLGDGVQVHGQIHTTNGTINVGDNSDVATDISTTNGAIHVKSAHIGGSIDTSAGSIDLGPNAHIDGNVRVEKDNSWNFGLGFGHNKPPEIIIRPGTVVKGTLHFERPVTLYVSDRATIGQVQGAEVHKFSGDNPPDQQ